MSRVHVGGGVVSCGAACVRWLRVLPSGSACRSGGDRGGDGGAEIGHVASTRESKQLETQLGNTYSVSRTCVGVGVELSNVKRRKTLYIRTTRTDSHVGRPRSPEPGWTSVDYRVRTATGQGRNGQPLPYDTGAADHVNLHDENRQHSRCRDWNYDSNNRM